MGLYVIVCVYYVYVLYMFTHTVTHTNTLKQTHTHTINSVTQFATTDSRQFIYMYKTDVSSSHPTNSNDR